MRKQYSLFFLCLLLLLLFLLTGCTFQQETLPYYQDSYNQDSYNQEAEKNEEATNLEANSGEAGDIVAEVLTIATPSPEPTPAPTDTPVPTATPEPVPTPYTVAWMPDTQGLSQMYLEILVQMREYILSVQEEYNIVAFFHTGDVVDSCGAVRQWDTATEGLMPLVEQFPTFMAAGNHDQAENRGEDRKLDLFTCRDMVQKAWEGMEVYKQGEVGYRIMELGEEEILIAVVSYGSSYRSRQWLAAELNAHPEIPAIIVTHSALFGDGRFTPDGNKLNQVVVTQCPSVRLVVCGHARGITSRRTDYYDDDGDGTQERSVTTMMCNFQEDGKNGLGYLRLLTFDPVSRDISVVTYSPYYDLYTYGDLAEEDMQFVLTDAF